MRLILPLALAILVTTLSLTAQPRPLPDAPLTPPPPRSSLPLASTASDTLHEAIWLPMGMGVRGDVVRMELVGHKLYAWHQLAPGGSSTDGEMISVWNGDGWDSVMRIDFGEIGSSMFAEYGGKLYVQGNLSDGMTRLYALDGAELDTISIASDSPMRMLVGKAIGTDFYVGGTFAALGRIPGARNIARWDGEGWHALGEGVDNRDRLVKTDEAQVVSMAEYHGKLFVGGIFSHAGEEHSPYLAIWNGSSWEKPAPGGPAGTGPRGTAARWCSRLPQLTPGRCPPRRC